MSVYNFAETIVAGSSAQGGSGVVEQSLKFNDDDNSYLSWKPAATSNRKTYTFSAWVKRANMDTIQMLFTTDSGWNGGGLAIAFDASNKLTFYNINKAYGQVRTVQVFRDPTAWYHILYAVDTTQAVAANRVKLYINGQQVTEFDTVGYPSQNLDTYANDSAYTHGIGGNTSSTVRGFDGYLSDVNFIDGQALTPTSFGETINNNWNKIEYTGTYGTNGFRLNFKDDVVSEGFNTVTYTGTGQRQSVSGVGFSPALVWSKSRTASDNHLLVDSLRGASKGLASNLTRGETTSGATNDIVSFDGDGFTTGVPQNYSSAGSSGYNIVSWCWEAGGTPTADNSAGAGATPTAGSVKIDDSNLGSTLAGTIPAKRLSANTTNGFSVVTYTGTGSNGTIAHGLGAAPKWVIVKCSSHDISSPAWPVWHQGIAGTEYLDLQTNGAKATAASIWNSAVPTNSVFSVGTTSSCNTNNYTYVAYCWAEVSGYSKFGSFTGNGGSQAIDVGFTPAFVMLRRTNGGTWAIFDNTRQSQNLQMIGANSAAIETTNSQMTFSGNTFNDNGYISDSGATVLYMAFADTREAAFFKDVSGQGNHVTPKNLDYRDSIIDSPANNFATLNPLSVDYLSQLTYAEGNLRAINSTVHKTFFANMGVSSGKWYWEAKAIGGNKFTIGLTDVDNQGYKQVASTNAIIGYNPSGLYAYGDAVGIYARTLRKNGTTVASNLWSSYVDGDIMGIAFDADAGKVWFHQNGIWSNGAGTDSSTLDPSNHDTTVATGETYIPAFSLETPTSYYTNFGQDSTFSGATPAGGNTDGNGIGTFKYAPPDGFLSLCTANLPTPTVLDGSDNFNTVLYTGDGQASRAINNVGFSPDFVWIKNRSNTYNHMLYDTIRGAGKYLESNTTATESTGSHMNSFDSDGFTVSAVTSNRTNANTNTYVGWNWKAGGTPTATNSAGAGNAPTSGSVMIDGVASTTALNGDIPATKISANTKSGFSIVSYTGTGATNPTVNHGLTKTPEFIILKDRDSNSNNNNWNIWHKDAGDGDDYGYFLVNAFTGSAQVIGTDNNVFTLKPNMATSNESGDNYIAYLFHSVEGMTKVGSWRGNGVADGSFVYTGFKPQWVLFKRSDSSTGGYWDIMDNKRNNLPAGNPIDTVLMAHVNTNEAGLSDIPLDFLSNGFKIRSTSSSVNATNAKYIYLAFAESPFKGTTAK